MNKDLSRRTVLTLAAGALAVPAFSFQNGPQKGTTNKPDNQSLPDRLFAVSLFVSGLLQDNSVAFMLSNILTKLIDAEGKVSQFISASETKTKEQAVQVLRDLRGDLLTLEDQKALAFRALVTVQQAVAISTEALGTAAAQIINHDPKSPSSHPSVYEIYSRALATTLTQLSAVSKLAEHANEARSVAAKADDLIKLVKAVQSMAVLNAREGVFPVFVFPSLGEVGQISSDILASPGDIAIALIYLVVAAAFNKTADKAERKKEIAWGLAKNPLDLTGSVAVKLATALAAL